MSNALRTELLWTALALTLPLTQPARAASFTTNSPMISAHEWHTATLLQNGKVLVAGGYTSYGAGYLPAAGTWTATGLPTTGRQSSTATLLPNGTVLVAGGADGSGHPISSVELYDP